MRDSRKINYPMVVRVTGFLLLIEAAFMLTPAVTAMICGENGAMRAFGISTAITAAAGAVFCRIRPARTDMGRREGFLLTASIWVVFSLFGMIPYMLAPTTRLDLSAAFFEAMSGFTTTGVSLVEHTDQLSRTINVWRCMSQWLGGMGIIIFTLAVIPMLNHSGGMQMFNAEATGITHDKIRPRISSTAKQMWGIYTCLTVLLFLLLWAGPMDAFDAACHAMATMSTGGFSTSSSGINAWPGTYVKVILTVFMFLGGVNFALIYKAMHGQMHALRDNDTFRTYLRVIALSTAVFIVCIVVNGAFIEWSNVTIDPLFQVVSSITSTGYSLSAFNYWGVAVVALSFILMFSGGCAGSTSGGVKVDRLVCLMKFLHNEVKRLLRPNSVTAVRVNSRTVPAHAVNKVVAFVCIYTLVIVLGGLLLTVLNVPMHTAFYSVFSCVSNAGFEAEVTEGTFCLIPPAGRWILAAAMLIGRLEIFTVLVLCTRSFWRR